MTIHVFVFQRDKEKFDSYKNKMLMPVSEVCISAIYDITIYHQCILIFSHAL